MIFERGGVGPLKKVLILVQRPEAQENANPSGLSEKKCLLCRKSAILSVRWKFYFRRGGRSPQKSSYFGATAPA